MENNIPAIYDEMCERGVSIYDLYIYSELMDKDGARDYSERELVDKIEEVRERYARDYNDRSIEYFVGKVLDEDFDDEEDIEW